MAPKKSSKRSESTRNGAASMRLKLTGRRSKSSKATIRRLTVNASFSPFLDCQLSITYTANQLLIKLEFLLCNNKAREVKCLKELLQKIECTVNSLAGVELNPRSLPSQSDSSGVRRLRLHFAYELPVELFTADIIYVTDTEPKVPVTVYLLDENNAVINEGQLSSLKLQVFVVNGDFEVEESEDWTGAEPEASSVHARKVKGSLLVGSCIRTMENGVCCFDDLKFADNSSWVPSQMFRLMVKVVDMVEIRPAVSGPFRVKDQRVKSHKKHPIPSWDDEVLRLKKIGKESHGRLKKAGIRNVKDFLQKYHIDQLLLRKILGVKNGAWETIIQHATKCPANGECFRYDSEEGVALFFDCFYKLIGVFSDHQNYRPVETLLEREKRNVERLRRCALEDTSRMVQVNNFPTDWPSASITPCMTPYPNPQSLVFPAHQDQPVQDNQILVRCSSFPQSPLWDPEILHHQPEDSARQNIEGICSIVGSDTMLWDPFMSDCDFTAYMLHGQGSSCEPVSSETGHVWVRAVFKLRMALRFIRIRRLACRS